MLLNLFKKKDLCANTRDGHVVLVFTVLGVCTHVFPCIDTCFGFKH